MNRQERLESLTRSWRWLFEPSSFELLEISPFGDLLSRDAAGMYWLLDVNFGKLMGPEVSGGAAAEMFPDNFDGRLASRYRDAGIELREGQCYAFTTPVISREGSYEPFNVYGVDSMERVSFMGDFHRQIQQIPDGTTVRIVIRSVRWLDSGVA
ncbi:hypothetical protein SAMN05421819_0228 [Bryocella elongata]|uniref:T6SS immunity protein Tdi1 C-terminal domain-containing protein n=1 Tax=Bryocella elongata TaxID=863522 RepID=A0A1H5SLC8_9BACT|nr:hypothetical protein [Bryocella elongata]SEF50651.1 hypothetical protein SAMN05421819_0228 [Bryocella elongata]